MLWDEETIFRNLLLISVAEGPRIDESTGASVGGSPRYKGARKSGVAQPGTIDSLEL